ncbi:C-X-C motif chemokine 11-1-like [Denticeps clupeoides]|uniref:C-X-C motif chemokine 11-1-like n=1 Tax=Denticeps clupeoides TaxID=299321 RepID=UPI0010A56930|nr:C-X-C motif chemokine 11-1-like [Denticeps clupeoides]
MKSAVLVAVAFVAFQLLVEVSGQHGVKGRCLCLDTGVKIIHRGQIEKVELTPASPSCANVEMIVTLKDGAGRKCVNPESKFAQNMMKRLMMKSSH